MDKIILIVMDKIAHLPWFTVFGICFGCLYLNLTPFTMCWEKCYYMLNKRILSSTLNQIKFTP